MVRARLSISRPRTIAPRAFTLLELVATLVVLAVLSGIAIPTYQALAEKSKVSRARVSLTAYARDVLALSRAHLQDGTGITATDLNDAAAETRSAAAAQTAGGPQWTVVDGSAPSTSYGVVSALEGPGGAWAFLAMLSGPRPSDPGVPVYALITASGVQSWLGTPTDPPTATGGIELHPVPDTPTPGPTTPTPPAPDFSPMWAVSDSGASGYALPGTGKDEARATLKYTRTTLTGPISQAVYGAVLRPDGTVWVSTVEWGGTVEAGTVTEWKLGLSDVVKLVDGNYLGTLALRQDGSLWVLGGSSDANGNDMFGTLGLTKRVVEFTQVPGMSDVVDMSTTGHGTLAVKADGTLWATGWNRTSALGFADTSIHQGFERVSGVSGVVAVAGGENHSVLLKADGTIMVTGESYGGALGLGVNVTRKYTFTAVPGVTGVTQVFAGDNWSMLRKADGTVWESGMRQAFSDWDNDTIPLKWTFTQVPELTGAVQLAVAPFTAMARMPDGRVLVAGDGSNGHFGTGQREYVTRVTWGEIPDAFGATWIGNNVYGAAFIR